MRCGACPACWNCSPIRQSYISHTVLHRTHDTYIPGSACSHQYESVMCSGSWRYFHKQQCRVQARTVQSEHRNSLKRVSLHLLSLLTVALARTSTHTTRTRTACTHASITSRSFVPPKTNKTGRSVQLQHLSESLYGD